MELKSASEIAASVRNRSVSAEEVIRQALEAIEEKNKDLNAFVLTFEDALLRARALDEQIRSGEDPGPLAGVPVGVKDNICTKGIRTTCCSKILDGWLPPYSATVVERLEAAGAIVVGKTNMDEFAMGSSTEFSCFGPTKNPLDPSRVPGGSSGGSAAAVAASMVPVALGSDTGGSIRQPAAFCGVVGLKPTYGLVSRYGLVAFASSLDQIGPIARSVKDCFLTLEVIAGHDPKDSTSLPRPAPALGRAIEEGVEALRIGVIRELTDSCEAGIKSAFHGATKALEDGGAVLEEVSIPSLQYALPAYYLLAPAEASSNLARFDGVRYGLRVAAATSSEMMIKTRSAGFGPEVRRRILLGTFALSAGYYDAYYLSALKVRTLISQAFSDSFSRFDALICPTSPTEPFRLGERLSDPLQMYLSDLCTIPANLAGIPALSVPFPSSTGFPVGVQIMAPVLEERTLARTGGYLEAVAYGR